MKAIYNSRVIPLEKIGLEINNRAFCYGDGLFETIVTGPERINLVHYHMARLKAAGRLLDIEIPFDAKLLGKMIEALKADNEIEGNCRARLQLWRNPGGLYEPRQKSASYLLTCEASEYPFYGCIPNLGFSQNAKVVYHQLSFAKTMSALPYVMAGLEKKQTGLDDLLITNEQGTLAEAIVSNLFWIKGETVYTPSLKTGCVAGTMRAYLIERMAEAGREVLEVETGKEVLKQADHIFLTNAAGIRWVAQCQSKRYDDPYTLLELYIKPLQLP